MRSASTRALGIVACLATACAHATALSQRSFTQPGVAYTTFFVLQGTPSGIAPIDDELASDIKLALADKGWLEVAPQDAQVVVITHVATQAKHSIDAFYAGWGDWTWRPAGAGSLERDYKPGTLIVDGFDATTRTLFWRAFAPDVLKGGSGHDTLITHHAVKRLARVVPPSAWGTGAAAAPLVRAAGDLNIVFAEAPVALVLIDGPPVYEAIAGTEFQRVVNTKSFIARDAAGMHYLELSGRWMEADTLMGPWTAAGVAPVGAELALDASGRSKELSFEEPVYGARTTEIPSVLVSTRPVTVVATEGSVQFTPLEGTSLLCARNASAPLLKEPTDNELYVRIADQWYRAWTIDGPWQNVPATTLPADFARVPASLLERSPSSR